VRLAWVPLAAVIPRALNRSLRMRDPMPHWSIMFIIGWTGMRGIVSLAAALALPFETAAGAPFAFRNEIVLLTFAVILSTLVLQGLSLPPLLRLLKLQDDGSYEREMAHARESAARAALTRLDELEVEGQASPEHLDRLRTHYQEQAHRFSHVSAEDPACSEESGKAYRRIRHEALTAERHAVIALRDDETISDTVLHQLEHELDVEALRIGTADLRTAEKHAKRRIKVEA
jgi:CPA1 family monovalent cation:H+ antiporter